MKAAVKKINYLANHPWQEGIEFEQKLFLVFLSATYASFALFNSSLLLKGNDFVQLQRSYFKSARHGKSHWCGRFSALQICSCLTCFFWLLVQFRNVSVKLFRMLLWSIYCTGNAVATSSFVLNIARPTSEFLSSVVLDSSCGPQITFLVTVSSSLLSTYLIICAALPCTIWVGNTFFIAFTLAEMLRTRA